MQLARKLLGRSDISTYNVEGDNLAVRLLNFPQLHQKVPEPGLRNDIVWRKYPHAIEFGSRIRLGGQMAANDLILRKTP